MMFWMKDRCFIFSILNIHTPSCQQFLPRVDRPVTSIKKQTSAPQKHCLLVTSEKVIALPKLDLVLY